MSARCIVLLCLWLLCAITPAGANDYYDLVPQRIAPDTYVFLGALEAFDFDNHGAVANSGFIVTEQGVVVIDTGPSRLYGEAMRAAIAHVTDRPVVRVYITHAHADHFLGNNAFADVPIAALPATARTIRSAGEAMARHLYDRVGAAMRGTSAVVPDEIIMPDMEPVVDYGDHRLELIATAGHSPADLMILDRRTGVLFAGDVVFHDRAPATPHGDIAGWQQALAGAARTGFRIVVPGHGPVASDDTPLEQTGAYLRWLVERLQAGAARGDSAAELMFEALPPRWAALAVQPAEYRRSVTYLYPALEKATLE
ncbi:quinoprotein relay system zinc metallohydrolase 1 [uncultured Salinisphaera sp.]|uniref:quinoprotein relay system zinc metallohydrolase 1 n=1 Tax=uncultured Salinisphaera sp. TaxID=359372 RepID=UPI0032B1A690